MPRSSRDAEFSAFVRTSRADLLRTACLLTAGDTHLAEDLVQTALARLYVAWPRVLRTGTAVAYVRRIIINAHIDETRRPRWRREQSVPELPDLPDLTASGPGFTGVETAGGEVIRSALAALPAGMRAVIVLRHWLDLSVDESADLLGCSSGTVKSQTAKGLARMRELLLADAAPVSPIANLERTSR
jgi:RNA polymerase sigma-70 factor (sigma-E family)